MAEQQNLQSYLPLQVEMCTWTQHFLLLTVKSWEVSCSPDYFYIVRKSKIFGEHLLCLKYFVNNLVQL